MFVLSFYRPKNYTKGFRHLLMVGMPHARPTSYRSDAFHGWLHQHGNDFCVSAPWIRHLLQVRDPVHRFRVAHREEKQMSREQLFHFHGRCVGMALAQSPLQVFLVGV